MSLGGHLNSGKAGGGGGGSAGLTILDPILDRVFFYSFCELFLALLFNNLLLTTPNYSVS